MKVEKPDTESHNRETSLPTVQSHLPVPSHARTSRWSRALVADTLAMLGIPTDTFKQIIDELFEERLAQADEILLDELRTRGRPIEQCSATEAAAVAVSTHRYFRAAVEGAARLNLRLLARVLGSQFEARGLYPDEFLRYADLLSSLSREEIILLGAWHRVWSDPEVQTKDEGARSSEAMQRVSAELIPHVFADEEALYATAASASRTGMLLPIAAWGGLTYKPTALLRTISELANFEACCERD